MKKRLILSLLSLLFILQICSTMIVPVDAAPALTITAPSQEFISKSDPPAIKWKAVRGAAGYRITVVNGKTGQIYNNVRNEWVSGTKYALSDIIGNISGYPMLKIWVGAMETEETGAALLAEAILWVTFAEKPKISVESASDITSDGATLVMSVEKNYGSAISDAGFYIGTSSKISRAEKYSFADYGPSSVVNNGEMTMEITGLKSNKKYYYWAYAENGVGETVTSSSKTFRTKEESDSLTLSKTTWSPSWEENSATITVTCSGSYKVTVDSEVGPNKGEGERIEWLTYTQSGSKLTLNVRTNYGASARKGTVTITCDGISKEIDVTQGKGAPAPALMLGISDATNTYDNTTWFEDGETYTYGPLTGNDVLYLKTIMYNAQRIYVDYNHSGLHSVSEANGWPNPNGSIDDEGFVFEETASGALFSSFNRAINTSPAPGTYAIKVTVSNSDQTNEKGEGDDWSIKKTVTLYVKIEERADSSGGTSSGSSEDTLEESFTSRVSDLVLNDTCREYMLKAIQYHTENSPEVISSLESGKSAVFIFDGCSKNLKGTTPTEDGYIKSGVKNNRSAVCVVVQYNALSKPIIMFASEASTTADQVRGINSGFGGRPVTIDGIHDLVTVNHKGTSTPAYAALDIINFDIIRCTQTVSKSMSVGSAGTGIHVHARQNSEINESSGDSTGCILIGRRIYDSNNEEYSDFIKTVTGFSKKAIYYDASNGRTTNAFSSSEVGKSVGVLIMDRSCYLEKLGTIFDDDTEAGGIEGNSIATKEDIAREITRKSIEWRREIMGDDSIVKLWDTYDELKINIKYESSTTVVAYEVVYDANGGSGAPDNSIVKEGTAIQLSTVEPTRSGYTFLGWATSQTASKAQYEPGDSYTVTEGVTFYAVWKKNSSGGSSSGPSSSPDPFLGDANGDGNVNLADAAYLKCYLSNPAKYPLKGSSCDYNGDGKVNMDDVTDLTWSLIEQSK